MNLLDGLKNIFGGGNQSVLGIDIGSSAIKIVQIRKKKGKAVLETYGELALGPYGGVEIGRATSVSGEKLIEALADILKEARTTTNLAGTALPLSTSLITFINVPAIDPKQISQMITIEARKYIPVPVTEVVLDWSLIPKEDYIPTTDEGVQNPEKQQSEVLLVAIHNEAIQNYQTLITRSSLSSSFFEIELFSSVRAVLEQGIQAQMIMDLGASTTKLYIIERGLLRTSHIINRGSQEITLALSKALSIPVLDAENMKRVHGLKGGPEHKEMTEIMSLTLDYIFYEANRVIFNYQKKHNRPIKSVILTGGGVLLKGFADLARTSFQNEVIYADPFGKLETPAFLSDQLQAAGPEFAVAIGVAMRRLSELK